MEHLNHVALLASERNSQRHTRPVLSVNNNGGGSGSGGIVLDHYSCSALEQLWISQGGNSGSAFIAAEIATAESGGNPNAISPTDDFGLWQINGSWGSAMASLNPLVNARSAISISHDGTDWSPWTTYTSGAYIGRCL